MFHTGCVDHRQCRTVSSVSFFFFNDTATTEIYTLSLHDALPISPQKWGGRLSAAAPGPPRPSLAQAPRSSPQVAIPASRAPCRSEEHTSELQSRQYLVCRLLLEKKKKTLSNTHVSTSYNQKIHIE